MDLVVLEFDRQGKYEQTAMCQSSSNCAKMTITLRSQFWTAITPTTEE